MNNAYDNSQKELLSRAKTTDNVGTSFERGMSKEQIRQVVFASRAKARARNNAQTFVLVQPEFTVHDEVEVFSDARLHPRARNHLCSFSN